MYRVLKLICEDPELAEKIANGGRPLLDLCLKMADKFDDYLCSCGDPMFADGIIGKEKEMCAGFLYQLYRGRLVGEDSAPSDLPELKDSEDVTA